MTLSTLFILAVAISRRQLTICDGFPLTPKNNNINNIRGGDGCNGFGNGGGSGDNNIPRTQHFYDEDGNGDIIACNLSLLWLTEDLIENDNISNVISEHEVVDVLHETKHIRGGGGVSPTKKKKSIGSSVNDSLNSIQTIMFHPFKSISKKIPTNPFKKRDDVEDEQSKIKQRELLSSTIVTSVSAPSSEVLGPDDIVQCAKESKLIGGTLSPETMEVTAKKINDLYLQEGYVMNSVTGAVLVPKDTDDDNVGHVELKVKEVKVARPSNNAASPLYISFIDKIKEEETSTDASSHQSSDIRYKIVSGRTRPSKIARMVNLVPGSNFQIRHDLWSQFSGVGRSKGRGKSAIFSTIHAIQPRPTSDKTAELQIIATENKPYTSLEYGVTKSLYSDEWEGELDLNHNNAFGGGEVATVNIRKGKSSSQSRDGSDSTNKWQQSVTSGPLNWRFSIKDDYLSGSSSNAGYDLEVFRDHVGVSSGENKAKMPEREAGSNESDTPITNSPLRTGASMRLKLPQMNRLSSFLPKAISTRLERVDPFTNDDSAQYIASTSTDIGPYNHKWNILSRPLRSTVSAIGSAGGRWNIDDSKALEVEKEDSAKTLQYATGTITSQQVMPLHNNREGVAAIDLTMKNVVSASTRNLPRHEAILLGLSSARIRGYKYNYQQPSNIEQSAEKEKKEEPSPLQAIKQFVKGGSENQFRPPIAIKNAISGSMEVRIPFERIFKAPILSSGTIIVFGDWCVAQALPSSSSRDAQDWLRHSSMGIGMRKAVQGIPLKIDACITEHGNKGLFFGIGV